MSREIHINNPSFKDAFLKQAKTFNSCACSLDETCEFSRQIESELSTLRELVRGAMNLLDDELASMYKKISAETFEFTKKEWLKKAEKFK